VVFHDTSSLPDNPGWALRNILYYLNSVHGVASINIICLRAGNASRQGMVSVPSGQASQERPASVGWERNKAGKLGSRMADLGPMMDPARYVLTPLTGRSSLWLTRQTGRPGSRPQSQVDAMANHAFS